MKSVMNHTFSQVPKVEIPRSVFDRSHGHKTTFNGGYLVPFYIDEALPGDTFKMNATIFARLQTQIVPVMDNLFLETFYFAVPYRLVWDNWEHFNGDKDDPDDDLDWIIPTLNSGDGFEANTLEDYFGLPLGVANIDVSCLWHRGYSLIYNEWFRDQNLQEKIYVGKDEDSDLKSNFQLRRRCKKHDYFTSCLPWPQKGDAVEIPLGATAPIYGDGKTASFVNSSSGVIGGLYFDPALGSLAICEEGLNTNYGTTITSTTVPSSKKTFGVPIKGATSGALSHMYADLSTATAATINSLREAFQLQRMYERDARGGTRYTEIIRSHFGVVSPDARLQRPEYLGGSSSRINVNPVQQTSVTGSTPQGNLAAYAQCADSQGGFTKSFTEHCLIFGLVNVRADLTYQRGIPRMFSRSTRFDFYWPALAHLGEQEVLNKEIFCDGSSADDEVFGYQERYAEYRYFPSMITGKFRSTDPTSLDVWHLSQDFATLPDLGTSFIQDNPPIDRIVAVTLASQPQILMDSFIQLHCARPMPVYSVPGLIDHF